MGQADNTSYLVEATRERSRAARCRAIAAIAELQAANQTITPSSVAQTSRVSRQWLYTCPETLTAIRTAASQSRPATAVRNVPRASNASMQQRIDALTDDNRRLKQRVADLEQRLATVYGSLRARSAT